MCGEIQSCSKGVPFDLETGNAEANRRFPNGQSGSSRPLGNKAGFPSVGRRLQRGQEFRNLFFGSARVRGQSMDIHRGRYSAPNARPREKEYRDVDAMSEFITRVVGYHMFRIVAALLSDMTRVFRLGSRESVN